jgi:hypothetical protein
MELEKQIHRSKQDAKAANWMIKAAKSADLDIEEGLQHEIRQKLGKRLQRSTEELLDEVQTEQGEHERKRESKETQKQMALKEKYDREIKA